MEVGTERGKRRAAAGRIGERLSYANVMSTIAVFGMLATGGAYAASQIGSSDIKRNAVRSKHIKAKQVKTADLANNAVTAPKLACKGNSKQDKMVRAGSVCIDRYESSIWTRKTGGTRITGALPCNANGQNCKGKIFARSVKGVAPRASITWFQAQQALANSGKRLPSNAEWQQAVAGTPDGAPCRVSGGSAINTGSAAGCVSSHGASDMAGNLWEWVADWVPSSTECPGWGSFSNDAMCLSGASTTAQGPDALIRGGDFFLSTLAGPFAISGVRPSDSASNAGFRGAR